MISVDEALVKMLGAIEPLQPVKTPLLDALDLILAETIVAPVDVPPFQNSAMDGYALRSADVADATATNPIRLRVVGTAPAGGVLLLLLLQPGEAVRIMTGALLPGGADAIVRFEEIDESSSGHTISDAAPNPEISVSRAVQPGENVRRAGEDISAGEALLVEGTQLRPPEIGLLASINRSQVTVHPRPRVAILSTGDEIAELGPELLPGQIRNSNSYLIAAMVKRFGGEPIVAGIAPDDIDALRRQLSACRTADLIVTSGGVSHGDFDMVKDVLQRDGKIAIWQVRMKPGKPLAFGRLGHTPLIGLPGNPVAAAVSFELFGRPAIARMLGRRNYDPPKVVVRLLEPVENPGNRRHFVRAIVERDDAGEFVARIAGNQGAGVMTTLARSNALLIVPEELEFAPAGHTLMAQLSDWPPDTIRRHDASNIGAIEENER